MNACKSCGMIVGCGCQLTNGLCSTCSGKLSTINIPTNDKLSDTREQLTKEEPEASIIDIEYRYSDN